MNPYTVQYGMWGDEEKIKFLQWIIIVLFYYLSCDYEIRRPDLGKVETNMKINW